MTGAPKCSVGMCAVVVDGVWVCSGVTSRRSHERVIVVALEEAQAERVEQHEHHALAGQQPALDLAGDVGERLHQAPSAARSSAVSSRELRACGSHATSTDRPSAATVPSGPDDLVRDRDALGSHALHACDDLDRAVVLAHLVAVVELDPHEHERERRRALHRQQQRAAALLQQLVVHGLVEVPEHVHVAPAQADRYAGLGAQDGTCASIAAAERSTSSLVVAQFETEIRSARRPRHSVALAQQVPSSWIPAVT